MRSGGGHKTSIYSNIECWLLCIFCCHIVLEQSGSVLLLASSLPVLAICCCCWSRLWQAWWFLVFWHYHCQLVFWACHLASWSIWLVPCHLWAVHWPWSCWVFPLYHLPLLQCNGLMEWWGWWGHGFSSLFPTCFVLVVGAQVDVW